MKLQLSVDKALMMIRLRAEFSPPMGSHKHALALVKLQLSVDNAPVKIRLRAEFSPLKTSHKFNKEKTAKAENFNQIFAK